MNVIYTFSERRWGRVREHGLNVMDVNIILASCKCNVAVIIILLIWWNTNECSRCLYKDIIFAICCRFFLKTSPKAHIASINNSTLVCNALTLEYFRYFYYSLILVTCCSCWVLPLRYVSQNTLSTVTFIYAGSSIKSYHDLTKTLPGTALPIFYTTPASTLYSRYFR